MAEQTIDKTIRDAVANELPWLYGKRRQQVEDLIRHFATIPPTGDARAIALDLVDAWICNLSNHSTIAAADQDSLVDRILAAIGNQPSGAPSYVVNCPKCGAVVELFPSQRGQVDAERIALIIAAKIDIYDQVEWDSSMIREVADIIRAELASAQPTTASATPPQLFTCTPCDFIGERDEMATHRRTILHVQTVLRAEEADRGASGGEKENALALIWRLIELNPDRWIGETVEKGKPSNLVCGNVRLSYVDIALARALAETTNDESS